MPRHYYAQTRIGDLHVVPSITKADLSKMEKELGHTSILGQRDNMRCNFPLALGVAFFWCFRECFALSTNDAKRSLKLIVDRENMGSTALGRGFAAPHAKTILINRVSCLFISFFDCAFDYGAIDRQPVQIFAVRLIPPYMDRENLKTARSVVSTFRILNSKSDKKTLVTAVEDCFRVQLRLNTVGSEH